MDRAHGPLSRGTSTPCSELTSASYPILLSLLSLSRFLVLACSDLVRGGRTDPPADPSIRTPARGLSAGLDLALEEGEEVESKVKGVDEEEEEGGLGILGLRTLESLEDALPIKRGLSNFYAGKSKSFTSLGEAAAKAAAKEIAKPENPFNKRRRVLAAWSRRRASCSSLVTTYLPPLLALDHTVVEEDEEDSDTEQCSNSNGDARRRQEPTFPPPRLSLLAQKSSMTTTSSSFRSPRSFSLSDLQNAAGYN
ncbi:hypothetical protein ABZP36_027317 [Zizania latifolia]